MAYTYSVWESDGVRTTYPYDLPLMYLEKSDVYVYAGEDTEFEQELIYRWVDSTTIELEEAPPFGTKFKIRRIVNRETLDYTFARMSIKGDSIDNQHMQLLMVSQELMDGFAEDPHQSGGDMRNKVGDKPDGIPLEPNEVWLANTQVATADRRRPLPAPDKNVPVGRRITIRDDTGNASLVPIIIEHAGNTIMGEKVDLAVTRNWAWVELICEDSLGKWRIEQGGVGASVKPSRVDVAEVAWPVGIWITSRSPLNPRVYLGIGEWKRVCEGRAIVGEGICTDSEGNTMTAYGNTKIGTVQTLLNEQNIPEMEIWLPEVTEAHAPTGTALIHAGKPQDVKHTIGTHDNLPFSNVQPSEVCYVWERTK